VLCAAVAALRAIASFVASMKTVVAAVRADFHDPLIGHPEMRVLARLYPQDKTQNASGLRRSLDPVSSASPAAEPPAYLPKNEEGLDPHRRASGSAVPGTHRHRAFPARARPRFGGRRPARPAAAGPEPARRAHRRSTCRHRRRHAVRRDPSIMHDYHRYGILVRQSGAKPAR
jgi:hypothetical protein